jgi:hypothetical protein
MDTPLRQTVAGHDFIIGPSDKSPLAEEGGHTVIASIEDLPETSELFEEVHRATLAQALEVSSLITGAVGHLLVHNSAPLRSRPQFHEHVLGCVRPDGTIPVNVAPIVFASEEQTAELATERGYLYPDGPFGRINCYALPPLDGLHMDVFCMPGLNPGSLLPDIIRALACLVDRLNTDLIYRDGYRLFVPIGTGIQLGHLPFIVVRASAGKKPWKFVSGFHGKALSE